MSASTDLAAILNLCIKEREELRELNLELLEELSNLADTARVAMLKANNHGAGYAIDVILKSAELAIAKAEKLK